MSRVVSKHLFHYQLNGVLSEEVEEMSKLMMSGHVSDPEMVKMKELSDNPDADCSIYAEYLRLLLPGMFASITQDLQGSIDNCVHTNFNVPLRDGNDFEVPVLVHTPTHLVGKKSNAAIIYAHGGGAVSGEAIMFKGELSNLAVETGVVFFNVDYRLAPETKFPKNALDFYCAVKHICENADHLGIDASRVAITGESGGGYICFATMVMLAQKDEGGLVKLAIPAVPMIDDYCYNDLASMTREEREIAPNMRKIWKCIARDLNADRSDPLLFPAKASDEILQKMPPTVIWENEFDIFITEATRMAHRMNRVGRLLEFRVQPGMNHMSTFIPGTKGNKVYLEDYKLMVKEYLLS